MNINLTKQQQRYIRGMNNEQILLGSSVGSQKSHTCRFIACLYALSIPKLQVVVMRLTSPEIAGTHFSNGPGSFQDMLKEEIEAGTCALTTAPYKIRFNNGSSITCLSCQNEADLTKVLGLEISVLILDESTTFTKKKIEFIRSRVRMSLIDEQKEALEKLRKQFNIEFQLPLIILATNPVGISADYHRKIFVNPNPPNTSFIDNDTGLSTIYIPGSLKENPYLDYDKYVKNLRQMGSPALVDAYLNGSWDSILENSAFPDWSSKEIVIEPFPIPTSWNITRSLDYGYGDQAAILYYAEGNGEDITYDNGDVLYTNAGDIFVIFEYVTKEKTSEELSIVIKKIESHMPNKIDQNNSPSDTNIWANVGGTKIIDGFTSNKIKWVKASKGPGSRETGYIKVCEYMRNSSTKEGSGLYIFNHCRNIISDLPILPRSATNPNDVDTTANDHTYDSLRYRLTMKQHKVVNSSGLIMG